MKTCITFTVFAISLVFCNMKTLAQNPLRMEVAFEGPWLFYVEPKFISSDGHSKSVLVAIAPQVAGHNNPVFSTGDGFSVTTFGTYCLAFQDQVKGQCRPNDTTALNSTGYDDPGMVPVYKPHGFDWTKLSAYIFILPMPDLYSADGKYLMSFQSAFPTPSGPNPTTTDSGTYSIGVQLHYTNGPQSVSLLGCAGTPSAATCNTPASVELTNTGTLRISMRRNEDSGNGHDCEYHARRAYHKMLNLVDPKLTDPNNARRAFVDVPKYDPDCSPCDPQQDYVSSDCVNMTMISSASEMNLPEELGRFVSFLQELNLTSKQEEQLKLNPLIAESGKLANMFPTQTQLLDLGSELNASEHAIELFLDADRKRGVRATGANERLITSLRIAASQEAALNRKAEMLRFSATSGKDCRAAAMMIQP